MIYGLLGVAFLVVWSAEWLAPGGRISGWTLLVVVLLGFTAVRGLSRRRGRVDWALNLGALVCSIVVTGQWGIEGSGGDATPCAIPLALTTMLAALGTTAVRVLVMTLVTSVVYVAGRTAVDRNSLGGVFDETLLTLSACWMLALLVSRLRQVSGETDALLERSAVRQAAAAHQTAVESAADDMRSMLHDQVITALYSLEQCRSGDRGGHREEATKALRQIRGQVRALADTVIDGESVATWQDKHNLRIEVFADPGFTVADLPFAVRSALVDATEEALRNVVRHSGLRQARLTLRRDSGVVEVEVSDLGVGFDPDETPTGLGLRRSVRDRVEKVGGSVTVRSGRAAGTTVHLAWPLDLMVDADEPPPPVRLLAGAGGTFGQFVWRLAVVGVAGSVWIAVRNPPPGSGVENALILVALLAVHVVMTRAVVREALTARLDLALHVSSYVLLAVNLWLAGDGALRGFDSWSVGLVTTTFVVGALASPAYRAIVYALPASLIVVAAACVDPTIGPVDVVFPTLQPAMFTTFAAVAAILVVRLRLTAEAEVEQLADLSSQAAKARAVSMAFNQHLVHLAGPVTAFLESAAAVQSSDVDAQMRETAHLLMDEARDDLNLPGVLTPSTRATIRDARRTGRIITISAHNALPEQPELVNDLLTSVAGLQTTGQVTVRMASPGRRRHRVAITGETSETQGVALGEIADEFDGDLTIERHRAILMVPYRGSDTP